MIALASGRNRQCKNNLSGVNHIYLFPFVKYSRSEIIRDGLTLTTFPATIIYKFEANNISFTDSQNTQDGGKYFDEKLNVSFIGLEINTELVRLLNKDYRIIIKDNNGLYRLLGAYNGLLTELDNTTGATQADFTGYNLSFEGQERQETLYIDDLASAGFTVSGDTPVSPYPLENIISEWKLDNNAFDTVGSNNGTATDISYVTGLVDDAADFTANTSRVVVADAPNLSFNNGVNDIPFSLTFAVKFHTTPTNQPVFFNKKSTSDGSKAEYQIDYTNAEGIQFQLTDPIFANRLRAFKSFTPTLNQWYHFTITYDGSATLVGMNIYFDGVLQIKSTLTSGTYTGMTADDGDVVIGANAQNTGRTLDGEMDVVRLWDKELSQTEITLIATAELAGTDINP